MRRPDSYKNARDGGRGGGGGRGNPVFVEDKRIAMKSQGSLLQRRPTTPRPFTSFPCPLRLENPATTRKQKKKKNSIFVQTFLRAHPTAAQIQRLPGYENKIYIDNILLLISIPLLADYHTKL